MFQWNITLSDKQVMMLVAFNAAEPDQNGSQFHAASAMIGDAWDVRAARKLTESGLLDISETQIGPYNKLSVWVITEKGRLICKAIFCDATALSAIGKRTGQLQRTEINRISSEKRKEKKK